METSLQRILCILITFCVALSCSDKKQDKPKILDKITALPEFKRESNRIDSLKATGRKVDLQIVVVSDSFYPEDSVKNISIVLIEEDLGFDQIPLFEVKFDKTTEEIISISDNANSNGPGI
jgi:hypothetical protein